jgi:hypothetical protein
MSAFGPKQTSQVAPHMSAFGGKADMTFCSAMAILGHKRTSSISVAQSVN